MNSVYKTLSLVTLGTAFFALPALGASDQRDVSHPAPNTAMQATQTASGSSRAEPTRQAHAEQLKAMQDLHEKMLSAKTPEERNALMATQMTLMHNGMSMMRGMGGMGGMGGMSGAHQMGGGAMMHGSGDVATRQERMEQRMEMMQAMMQLMVDRMQPVPAPK